ncbi:MAG TPA: FAD-binding oxidoreductase [Polyangiales bacterium]
MNRRRKFWGWGYEGAGPDAASTAQLRELVRASFQGAELRDVTPPRIEEIMLRAPRISVPAALAPLCTADPYERAGHTYGKAFRDLLRALDRNFENAPDLVAYPRSEADVVALLDHCETARIAAIPYGGGSSVVGGVEARIGDGHCGALSIDLGKLDQLLEVDRASRAVRFQAGVLGPALEAQLKPHGYTLRHFPQSFELSTLGGWIATRAGGHFATLYTHIDDLVESMRVVTPRGTLETRRLPGSGAGPSPDRLFLGSEGTLGVITEAWMRVQERPRFRASASVTFRDFRAGAQAVRALSQAGLYPSNCRLLDPVEALISGAASGQEAVLLVAFESADHALDAWMQRALECCRDHGGAVPEGAGQTRTSDDRARSAAEGAWRKTFLEAPYLRDVLACMGMITETFETAITWDKLEGFYEGVVAATRDVVVRLCGSGSVGCRFTHVYPDGPAPYFTVIAPGKPGGRLAQWDEIKRAASDAILSLGGTITHHHAVGRDHRPWYDRERPELFAAALRGAKRELDPANILNPGVLFDV